MKKQKKKKPDNVSKGNTMTVNEAAKKWNLSVYEVRKICSYYNFIKQSGKYIIPDDVVPVCIPDKRITRNPLRYYLFVCDAINKKLSLDYELLYATEKEIKTAVSELKRRELIICIEGMPDDLDYRNYMLGISFSEWDKKKTEEKLNVLSAILGTCIEAGVRGVATSIMK